MLKRHIFLAMLLGFWTLGLAQRYELKNAWISLEANPAGGRISRLEFGTPAMPLTFNEGLLGDNFHNIADAKFFLTTRPYSISVEPGKLIMKANHRGGGIDFMELTKTVELPQDEALLKVLYSFHNLPAAMATLEYGFWSQNFIGQPGANVHCFFPCINGIQQVAAPRPALVQSFYKNPSRGWLAYARPEGGGMAITFDYKLAEQTYGYFSKTECTQEFYLSPFPLAVDETRQTCLELIPFHTLKAVSGAGNGLVGEMFISELPNAEEGHLISLNLYSAKKQAVRLKYSARRLREGLPEEFYACDVEFAKPATLKTIERKHHFRVSPAIFDIEVRAYGADGKLLTIFNSPLGINASTISYRMTPECERLKARKLDIPLTRQDKALAPAGNGIRWAEQLSSGKLRITALTPYQSYREVAEIAASINAELNTTLFLSQGRAANTSGDFFGMQSETDIQENIDVLLQMPCDVILLGGVNTDKLTEAQKKEIVSKVENGCGLLMQSCSGADAGIKSLRVLTPSSERSWPSVVPCKCGEGFLSTAIPWGLFPATSCIPCTAQGDMLAKVGRFPYFAMKRHQLGLVAEGSWIGQCGDGRMVGGITPELPWPMPKAAYRDYPELYRLLLAKALVMLAKKEPELHFTDIDVKTAHDAFVLDISLAGWQNQTEEHTLTLFTRNRDGKELTRCHHPFVPKEKQRFTVPAKAWNGAQLIGLIMKNSKGETVDFGAVQGERLPAMRLVGIAADKTHYQEGENALFAIKAAGETREAVLRWSLRDAFGRIVQKGKQKAAAEMAIKVPVNSTLRSRCFTFNAEILVDAVPVDSESALVTVTPKAEKLVWDDFETGIWITPYTHEAVRSWLYPEMTAAIRKMGFSMIMANTWKTGVDFAQRYNFEPSVYQANGTHPSAVDPQYHTTHDKYLLKRKPCLTAPEFRQDIQKKFLELGKKAAPYAPRFYWFGDELSLTGYWSSAVDFCFSQTCLEAFSAFMKNKYGTVENANRQWGTAFKAFSGFIPETLEEARARKDGNYSAWADHLEYMDHLLVEYIGFFTGSTALHAGDSNARTFISGPQKASAYGGNNWEIQGPAYTGLLSYPSEGLQEILHSFAPDTIDMPWDIGYANYDGQLCYRLWRSLQFRARGAMGFSSASLLKPDFTLSHSGGSAARFVPEIQQSGIGKLVVSVLKERTPQIEILYSQPSIRAATIMDRAKVHDELRMQYITLCRNFGIPFRFTSHAEIESGTLLSHQPRLLVCPDSDAVSDRMLEEIHRYIQKGGHVLADANFAGMDASCKRIQNRVIPFAEQLIRKDSSDIHFRERWEKEASLRTLDETAALESCRRMFEGVLRQAGIPHGLSLVKEDGTPWQDAEIAWLVDSRDNLFAIAITKEKLPVKVSMQTGAASPCRIVDVRHNQAVDPAAKLEICNDNPLFLAWLPSVVNPRASGLENGLRLTHADNGRKVTLDIDISPENRDTVFRVTFVEPHGREVPHYAANVAAPGGKASFHHEFAFNDAIGDWRVHVKDVVTGEEATRKVRFSLQE